MDFRRGAKLSLQLSALLALVLITAMLTAGYYLSRKNPVAGFSSESAKTSFMSYATRLAPLKRLELAQLQQVELFERKSEASLFWKRLELPEVIVGASVPVEYRYSVDLGATWKIHSDASHVQIQAPALEHSTPAANISLMKFEVKKGSILRDEKAVTQALQDELTALLEQRAIQSKSVVRETARKQLETLAKDWLRQEGKTLSVGVTFGDESAALSSAP